MALDTVPWYVGGTAIHSADVARLVGYAAVGNTQGILAANDLSVTEATRGKGTGRALIDAGVELTREWGASHLAWATAPDNHTAQRLYDSTTAHKSTWIEYEIEV